MPLILLASAVMASLVALAAIMRSWPFLPTSTELAGRVHPALVRGGFIIARARLSLARVPPSLRSGGRSRCSRPMERVVCCV